MLIAINHTIELTPFYESDAHHLAIRINDKRIADNTLTVPFPYQLQDAELFIQTCITHSAHSIQRNWAIRHRENGVIGGIGMHLKYGLDSHKDEIGYWLTPEYWGRGLMTEIVGKFVSTLVQNRNLNRIEAPIFHNNRASARVLEKNGFEREGIMKNCYRKKDVFYDSILYAKIISHEL